jgi:hypothetical protein
MQDIILISLMIIVSLVCSFGMGQSKYKELINASSEQIKKENTTHDKNE